MIKIIENYDNEQVLDSGYCNKDEWKITKQKQIELWTKRGYTNVKCVLQRSDTIGLRMWMTYGTKQ